MQTTLQTLEAAFANSRPALAFSGGCDSQVLAHLTYTRTPHRPPLFIVDTGLMPPGEIAEAQAFATALGTDLQVAHPDRDPLTQWQAQGWPILGPLPARKWTARNKHLGIRLNCEACCGRLKIMPGRKLTRALGCNAQLTGLRASDDDQRAHQLSKRGNSYVVQGLRIVHPLAHWTDTMIRRYRRAHALPDPASMDQGQASSGCDVCAGAWRFWGNALADARTHYPQRWWWFVVECGGWLPLLVVKTGKTQASVAAAVERLGGPEAVATKFPEAFDYAQAKPLRTYTKT
jgi:3'-phosphoadenosine 5'-phosphosulfate sulfotransferase (PAPS reductase)/FAD synthetase